MSYPTPPPAPSTSPSTASPAPTPNPIPDADNQSADLPLTMSASVLLTSLPRDAKSALSSAAADDSLDQRKVTIRFQPIGSAPILRTRVFKISASQRFDTVVAFLRRRLDGALTGPPGPATAATATATATATGPAATAAGAGSAAGGGNGSGNGNGNGKSRGRGRGRVGERDRGESVFCYVNSCFAPGGDEVVGNLWRCFKTDDQLIVAYAMTPAFG